MNDVDAFVLAGGASSRMRRDKSQLKLGDRTFIELAAIAARAIAGKVFIVGNLPFEKLCVEFSSGKIAELPVLTDVYKSERRAAIIGLHTALVQCKADWALVRACDLPFASGALLARLASFRDERFGAVVPLQPDGKTQPLCAFYRRAACLPPVEETLNGEDWSLRQLTRRIETRFVEFSEISDLPGAEHFFLNVNTPADFDSARDIERRT